jgi:hypothetical protein
VTRKNLTVLLAAIIIPGGFIALIGGWLLQRASKTERGRRVLELARTQGVAMKNKVPVWLTTPFLPARQQVA